MKILKKIESTFTSSYTNDKVRRQLMFQILNLLLCAVAFVMSVMNVITGEYILFWITAAYTVLCLLNFLLSKEGFTRIELCFFLETIAMLAAFIVTGIPDGFSLLWTLLIPACALAIFGLRTGSLFSAGLFLVVIFFFWLPFGQSLLRYSYSDTYMLRFPVIYLCVYLISLYVEWIRRRTYERLVQAEEHNRWLYRHDALTGAYNRHAFYEELNRTLSETSAKVAAIIMIDIDDFKQINDTYGHNAGDRVLCRLADIIQENICEHCLFCRWGGEEFLIVMRCQHDAAEVAERVRRDVENTELILEDKETIHFTISAGIVLCDAPVSENISRQIDRADKAMYAAKRTGKNRVVTEK